MRFFAILLAALGSLLGSGCAFAPSSPARYQLLLGEYPTVQLDGSGKIVNRPGTPPVVKSVFRLDTWTGKVEVYAHQYDHKGEDLGLGFLALPETATPQSGAPLVGRAE